MAAPTATPAAAAAATPRQKRMAKRVAAKPRELGQRVAQWDQTRNIYSAGALKARRRPADAAWTPLAQAASPNAQRPATVPASGSPPLPQINPRVAARQAQRARIDALSQHRAPRGEPIGFAADGQPMALARVSSPAATDGAVAADITPAKAVRPASRQRLARLAQPSPKIDPAAAADVQRSSSPGTTAAASTATRERLARLSQPIPKRTASPPSIGAGLSSPSGKTALATMSRLLSLSQPRQVSAAAVQVGGASTPQGKGGKPIVSKAEYDAAIKAMSGAQEMKGVKGAGQNKVFMFDAAALTAAED